MAKKGDIFLGATAETVALMSPFGRNLTVGDIELSRSDRTSSGKLRKDIYAQKKKITLDYETIDGDELDKYITLYETWDTLILQIQHTDDPPSTTPEPESYYDEYEVIMEPIDRKRLILRGDGLWEGIKIELNEV
jgi:hypothetical protein